VEVFPWVASPWRAWRELFAERDHTVEGVMVGMGAGRIVSRPCPIRYQALLAWCHFERLSVDEAHFVMSCVRSLDSYYVNRTNKSITENLNKLLKA